MDNNDDTLERLCEAAHEFAARCCLQMQEELFPVVLLVKTDGAHEFIQCHWPTQDDKPKVINHLIQHILASEVQISAYSLVAESWSITRTTEQLENEPYVEPRLAPDRQSIVFVTASDGQRLLCRDWLIKTDPDGRRIALVEDTTDPKKLVSAWIIKALDQAVLTRRQRF